MGWFGLFRIGTHRHLFAFFPLFFSFFCTISLGSFRPIGPELDPDSTSHHSNRVSDHLLSSHLRSFLIPTLKQFQKPNFFIKVDSLSSHPISSDSQFHSKSLQYPQISIAQSISGPKSLKNSSQVSPPFPSPHFTHNTSSVPSLSLLLSSPTNTNSSHCCFLINSIVLQQFTCFSFVLLLGV